MQAEITEIEARLLAALRDLTYGTMTITVIGGSLEAWSITHNHRTKKELLPDQSELLRLLGRTK